MSEMSVSEAREHFAEAVDEARSGNAVFVTKHGKPVVVILDADEYERIVEAMEDEEDLREARLALEEDDWIPWEQVKADLGLT